MGGDLGHVRIAAVNLDAGPLRRLAQATGPQTHVQATNDALQFAKDAATNLRSPRAIILRLAGRPDWSTLEHLRAYRDHCPVTVLHSGDDRQQLTAIAGGANAVLPEEAAPARILLAVQATLAGDSVIPDATLARFSSLLSLDGGADGLLDHERYWLAWLADGRTVQDLADRSGWSSRQMRRRLTGLYLRLGVTNRDQAVAFAARYGDLPQVP